MAPDRYPLLMLAGNPMPTPHADWFPLTSIGLMHKVCHNKKTRAIFLKTSHKPIKQCKYNMLKIEIRTGLVPIFRPTWPLSPRLSLALSFQQQAGCSLFLQKHPEILIIYRKTKCYEKQRGQGFCSLTVWLPYLHKANALS